MDIKIAFLDCDGTLTKIKSSWEYLHRRLNIWDGLAVEYQELFRAGKINYREFCERDAALWKGLRVNEILNIINEIEYREGVKDLIEFLKSYNIYTVIISTGLSLMVEKVKKDLCIDMAFSNELVVKNNILTGGVRINVDFNKKGEIVKHLLTSFGLKKEHACAIGDGEGDEGLFDAVKLAIITNNNNKNKQYFYCDTLYEAKKIIERHVKK